MVTGLGVLEERGATVSNAAGGAAEVRTGNWGRGSSGDAGEREALLACFLEQVVGEV